MIRLPTHRSPTHPGEMLSDEFLGPMGLTSVTWQMPFTSPISASTKSSMGGEG